MRKIRPAVETDHPLIYSTWLRSQRFGNTWFTEIEQDAYYNAYKKYVAHKLATRTVEVACLESDPDVVLGYVVYGPDAIDFVYCKRAWRQLGIAKSLVPPNITISTSLTKMGKLAGKGRFRFDPFR